MLIILEIIIFILTNILGYIYYIIQVDGVWGLAFFKKGLAS